MQTNHFNGDSARSADATRGSLPWTTEQVHTNTARMPEGTREAVRELFTIGKQQCLSAGRLGEAIGRDGTVVSRLFTGKYEVDDFGPVTRDVEKFLRDFRGSRAARIANTSTTRKIADLCELVWEKRRIGFIYGDSQTGKSEGVTLFAQERNSARSADATGLVRLMTMPAGGSKRGFLEKAAVACARSVNLSYNDLRNVVFNTVTRDDLVIIDEFSRCFNPVSRKVMFATIEIARELWDTRKCGLVLVMTDIARDELQEGAFAAACAQLLRRSVVELQLEPLPPDRDVAAIAAVYGLPKPGDVEKEIIDEVIVARGLTKFTTLLESACDIAAKASRAVRWGDFVNAHDAIARLAQRAKKGTR